MVETVKNLNKANFFGNIPNDLAPWFPDDKPMWFILENIDKAIKQIFDANSSKYKRVKENVYAHETVVFDKYVEIKGPAIIGKGCVLRHGAFLRENVIIGDNCVIGNSTEVKNSVLFSNVEVPHFNYIGDSILGNYVHFGAGAIISNVLLIKDKGKRIEDLQKNNAGMTEKAVLKEIKIKMTDGSWIDTGRKKFGAVIGDYAEIGVNSTINPGTLLEMNMFVPSSISIGGYFKTGYVFPKTIVDIF